MKKLILGFMLAVLVGCTSTPNIEAETEETESDGLPPWAIVLLILI